MLSLLAPWFLVGLGALSVPVLVHLIQKERKEVIPFPSLMFIENIPYQSARRQRIRNWLLFLLRCLALICLVLAFARPFFSSRHALRAGAVSSGGRDIIIALDRSYSMGYGDRWRKGVAAAKGVIGTMGRDDRAAVVYFSGTASAATPFTGDQDALRAAIDSVKPVAGGTRYDAMFRFVQNLFADTARPHREVVLVSDYQRSGWSERELPRLPVGTKLTQVDLGSTATTNVVIAHVNVRYDTSDGHERANVEATLANRGATPVVKRPVTFELNGRPIQTRLVDCPANGTSTVAFDGVPAPPGVSRGSIRAAPDSLDIDNHFYFIVEHDPSLPVLLVEPTDADPKAGMFLTLALGITRHLSFRIKTVHLDRLSPNDLRERALVVLDGVPMPGGDLGRQLVDYVKSGGGLFVVLGPQSHPEGWSQVADNLLPRPGAAFTNRGSGADRGATLEFVDRGHAVFEAFSAPRSGDFSAARFVRYWPVHATPADRQLARFDDGSVALLERRVGAGRVLVWSSDLNGSWNDFPLQPVFLPLIHQVAKYAAGYEADQPWQTVGDVVNLPTLFGENARRADTEAEQSTANSAQYVAISPSGAQTRFTTNAAGRPNALELAEQGFYDIKRSGGAGDSARTVAVNVDLAESDLTPLDTGLLAAAVAPRAATAEQMTEATTQTAIDLERRQSVWWWLLAAALLFLGAETLLSNRLSGMRR